MIGHFTYPFRLSLEWGWRPQAERLDGRPNTYYDLNSKIIVEYFRDEAEALAKFKDYIDYLGDQDNPPDLGVSIEEEVEAGESMG